MDYHGASSHPVRERREGVNLKVALVTGNLFDVLGVTPLLGRSIRAEDDSVAAAPVVAISYDLWQRRYDREVGIWMALGAPKSVVLRAVMLDGTMMTLVGMIGSAAIAALIGGWLELILYGVSRHDPVTIAGVALVVCFVTRVATHVPARRASSVDPTEALRE